MAELRHYLTSEIYIRVRLPFKKMKIEVENILREGENRGYFIKFDNMQCPTKEKTKDFFPS